MIVHAKSSANQTARTPPFGYLVTTSPVTACGASDGGGGTDAGTDAGGTDASDCSNALNPTWSQGSGANNWWVEYAVVPNTNIARVYLEVVGGQTVQLSPKYGKWVGRPNGKLATGATVTVHAQDKAGNQAQTVPFGYLSVKNPTTQPCSN